jgi:hypothetical protein
MVLSATTLAPTIEDNMKDEQRTQLACPGDVGDALMDCGHDETACEVCANIVPITDARHAFPWWRRGDDVVHCKDCTVQ